MADAPRSRNPFFPLAVVFSALFIITILAIFASVFGDERAPLARLLDQYAGRLIGGEVVAILVTGFLALLIDRRQTLRSRNDSLDRALKSSTGTQRGSPPPRKGGPGGVG